MRFRAERRARYAGPACAVTAAAPEGRPIALAAALPEAAAGAAVLLPGLLQAAGLFEPLRAATLAAIAADCGRAAADAVAGLGFERLHEALTPSQVHGLYLRLHKRLRPQARPLARRAIAETLGWADGLHAYGETFVRIMIPEAAAAGAEDLLGRHVGHTAAHPPHRDSWLGQPLNGLVLWIALGPVRRGNGLLLYPESWGRPLRHAEGYVMAGEPLGPPIAFALAPGDGLLFGTEQLHASEVNRTDRTRYALSLRFCIGPPRYGERRAGADYRPVRPRPFARLLPVLGLPS